MQSEVFYDKTKIPYPTHFLQPLDVAFFRPLKQRWRKVLDDYKSSRGKKASTLSKEVFPRLLKNLQGAVYLGEDNHNDNLVSGFRKCGIVPFDPEVPLERLPDSNVPDLNESSQDFSSRVSNAVIEILRDMRGVDDTTTKKKKRKIAVQPGRSIRSEDLHEEEAIEASSKTNVPQEETENDQDESVSNIDLSYTEDNVDVTGAACLPDKQNASRETQSDVGTFVIVQYEGSRFPGKVTSCDEEGARVSTLKKCKHVGWNWPAFKYEIDYDWKDIVKKNVKAIPVNNRGQFLFPDLEEEWGK